MELMYMLELLGRSFYLKTARNISTWTQTMKVGNRRSSNPAWQLKANFCKDVFICQHTSKPLDWKRSNHLGSDSASMRMFDKKRTWQRFFSFLSERKTKRSSGKRGKVNPNYNPDRRQKWSRKCHNNQKQQKHWLGGRGERLLITYFAGYFYYTVLWGVPCGICFVFHTGYF